MTIEEYLENHGLDDREARTTGERETHCPCCGAVSDTYYKSAITFLIVGCDHCIREVPYYEV